MLVPMGLFGRPFGFPDCPFLNCVCLGGFLYPTALSAGDEGQSFSARGSSCESGGDVISVKSLRRLGSRMTRLKCCLTHDKSPV